VATELGGTQITSLMETLPGIASVLRNPVADAFVGLIRSAARMAEFKLADAEEILRYAVRRNLMTQDETDRVLAEIKATMDRRAERALEREKGKKAVIAAKVQAKPKLKPAKKPAKALKRQAPKAKHRQ